MPERVVFVDETSVKTNLTRILARIPDCKINRVDDLLPWKTAS